MKGKQVQVIIGIKSFWNQLIWFDFKQSQNTMELSDLQTDYYKNIITKNFQVAKTSRPLIFTDDDSNASFAFFMLINFAVMTIGRFNIDLGYRH